PKRLTQTKNVSSRSLEKLRASSSSGSSNANGSPSSTSSASSAKAHIGSSRPTNTSSTRQPWRRSQPSVGSRDGSGRLAGGSAIVALDVGVDQADKLAGDILPAQRDRLPPVLEHRGGRGLARARQRDADVGVARLARPVDHAAHHRQGQVLRARMGDLPL